MSNKEISPSAPTMEIFATEDETGRPLAFAMNPDNTDRERLRLIIRAQIDRVDPKTIFCNIGGVYDMISSTEFNLIHNKPDREINGFVEELIAVFKGPYTSDIIISDPPIKPSRTNR